MKATIQLKRHTPDDSSGVLSEAVYRLQRMMSAGKCSSWQVLDKDGTVIVEGPKR